MTILQSLRAKTKKTVICDDVKKDSENSEICFLSDSEEQLLIVCQIVI